MVIKIRRGILEKASRISPLGQAQNQRYGTHRNLDSRDESQHVNTLVIKSNQNREVIPPTFLRTQRDQTEQMRPNKSDATNKCQSSTLSTSRTRGVRLDHLHRIGLAEHFTTLQPKHLTPGLAVMHHSFKVNNQISQNSSILHNLTTIPMAVDIVPGTCIETIPQWKPVSWA